MIDLRQDDVLEVENWNTDPGSAPGTWPCGICRRPHTVTTSWYVEVENGDGRVRLVACERCARLARETIAR